MLNFKAKLLKETPSLKIMASGRGSRLTLELGGRRSRRRPRSRWHQLRVMSLTTGNRPGCALMSLRPNIYRQEQIGLVQCSPCIVTTTITSESGGAASLPAIAAEDTNWHGAVCL